MFKHGESMENMHHVPAKQARADFTHIVDDVAFRGERYVITRNGRDLVAMVPISDLETLQALDDQKDCEAALRAEKYISTHGTEDWEEIEKRLGIDGE